jgi:uncharacterized phage protein gp47/JayE
MAQYADQTKDTILQRMLATIASDIDKRQGSISYDMLSPAAIEMALAYISLDNVLNFGFADTTYGEYLDRRASELGLTRKPAVISTGTVTFSGTNGTVVPTGTEVYTADEVYFVTTASGTIASGTTTVAAEAKVGGANGNVAIGSIKFITGNLTGVTTVTNNVAFDGGADIESDASLLSRYKDRVSKPATSGNKYHYIEWAKSVAGIGDAKCFPIWNGNGTVKVTLLDEDKTAPPSNIVTDVATYIESVRPIGATVTVVAATEVPINITATLTLASGKTVSDVSATIQSGVVDYLKSIAYGVDTTVRYSRIANVILDTDGVVDYSGLTINGGSSNITIADGSVAVIGSVTLT